MAKNTKSNSSGHGDIGGITCLVLCVLLFMGFVSYNPFDLSLFSDPPNEPARNFIGPLGAWVAFGFFMAAGVGAYLIPFIFAVIGLLLLIKSDKSIKGKLLWLLVLFLSVVCMAELMPELFVGPVENLNLSNPGGLIGTLIGNAVLIKNIGAIGTAILLAGFIISSLVMLFEVNPLSMAGSAGLGIGAFVGIIGTKLGAFLDRDTKFEEETFEPPPLPKVQRKAKAEPKAKAPRIKATPAPITTEVVAETEDKKPKRKTWEELKQERAGEKVRKQKERDDKAATAAAEREAAMNTDYGAITPPSGEGFTLPPMDILDPLPAGHGAGADIDIDTCSALLEETLRQFGVDAQVVGTEQGPTVTSYEVLPAPGVRVEKISGLSNNIALALKAESIRVQAPVPGKGVVGIEIPNPTSEGVFLRQMLKSKMWKPKKMELPLILGMDVSGKEIIADLTDMPHMLIAGATGAGKSVCMNSLLAGLLMSRTPEQLRLMLVDPKVVEFTQFNDLPHLVVPVITDVKKVSMGLRWAINEMEKRLQLFSKVGVRNIKAFNERKETETEPDLFEQAAETSEENFPQTLPYIVIIIDEMADLIIQAKADVENSIARIAQLARAVGIHMILATQRPSVNVITGTIKANLPARVAFKVAQKVDSRTILDGMGAEHLLGKGDLLFLKPGAPGLIRAQGTFTSDNELNRIVDYVKQQGKPEFISEIKDAIDGKKVDLPGGGTGAASFGGGEEEEDDELIESAVEVIRQTKRASTSSLQRRLRIGYNRAARLMDALEEKGIIGPPNGSEPREILIDLDGDIPENSSDYGNEAVTKDA